MSKPFLAFILSMVLILCACILGVNTIAATNMILVVAFNQIFYTLLKIADKNEDY